jgi:Leucine-rich repeat (LRR) protein
LNLTGNNIGDEGLEIVLKALANKKKQSLQRFSVSSNKITSAGCKALCDFIMNCYSLEELQMANNEIDNVGAQHLIKVLKGKNQLTEIDIDNNKISGSVLTDLFNILPLRNLNLMKNVLTDEQVAPISKTLSTNLAIQ